MRVCSVVRGERRELGYISPNGGKLKKRKGVFKSQY